MEGPRLLDVLLVGVAAARPRRLDGLGVWTRNVPPLPLPLPPDAGAPRRGATLMSSASTPPASRSVASWTRLLRAKLVRRSPTGGVVFPRLGRERERPARRRSCSRGSRRGGGMPLGIRAPAAEVGSRLQPAPVGDEIEFLLEGHEARDDGVVPPGHEIHVVLTPDGPADLEL
jgi:hypothetical protein